MDTFEKKILKVLEKNEYGLTITAVVNKTKFSRDTVRIKLNKLEGEDKISHRTVGMAKIYIISND